MRGLLALATAAALLAGCAAPAARPAVERQEKAGYNRREMPTEKGLFTGPDGVWTIYRNDADRPAPGPPKRTTLSCERGQTCDPPAGEREEPPR